MNNYLLISDAAKEVKVESHVLRYWEEELHLPIKRNELGHRYYTAEDVERFKQIKSMKERGLQLKAIKMILKDGRLNVLSAGGFPGDSAAGKMEDFQRAPEGELAIDIIDSREAVSGSNSRRLQEVPSRAVRESALGESREEKAGRLQWLLQQLIRETLLENNQELCREIKDSVVKELDYQFRMQEEREELRDKANTERSEEYYRRMDDLLRKKSRRFLREKEKQEKSEAEEERLKEGETQQTQKAKKKRHSIF